MCVVRVPEIPTVDVRFWRDECPCLRAPREMVEIWRPGYQKQATTPYSIADVRRHRPELWAAIAERYDAWKAADQAQRLIAYEPAIRLKHEPAADRTGRR